MFDVVLRPDELYQRFVIERYGSMLMPGVGTFTATPPPAVIRVSAGEPLAAAARAAPTCRLSETGIRLPPMMRNAALPPTDVTASAAPFGFHDTRPAVRPRFARPSVARAPNAVPLPKSELGMPRSPLIVTPVPPFGLFHTGTPVHCAAAGLTANATRASTIKILFICNLRKREDRDRHLRPRQSQRYARKSLSPSQSVSA